MAKSKICKPKLDLYDVSDILNVFGKYQVIQYALIFIDLIFIAMIDVNYVFVAGDLNYRCRISECEDTASTAEFPQWWPNSTRDRCRMPVLKQFSNGTCTNVSFSNITEKCTEWIYESNNTVVGEFHLACQPWYVNIIGSIHSTGMLISMLATGYMLDRFGRKPTLILCIVGSSIGSLKIFATSWLVYIIIEFFEACMSGGSYTAALLLMLEIVGRKRTVLSSVLFSYFIYMGECILACIAMFVPYWKNIVCIVYCPCIFFIFYIYLINESPRWQIVTGRNEDAKETMLRIAKMNNIEINCDEINKLDSITLKEKFNIKECDIKEKPTAAFISNEILKRLLVSSVCRFTTSFVYYGLMINSVWLPGNKYVNFMLSTVMSFPGELLALFLLDRVGRRLFLMVGLIISGALCVGSAYMPDSYTWIKIIIFLIGKMIIAACFTGSITYTMELFPTSTRGILLGLGSIASRLGGMLAPLTPILNATSRALPAISFGSMAVLSSALLLLTPETKDLPLMDTVQQIEDSVKNAKINKANRNMC